MPSKRAIDEKLPRWILSRVHKTDVKPETFCFRDKFGTSLRASTLAMKIETKQARLDIIGGNAQRLQIVDGKWVNFNLDGLSLAHAMQLTCIGIE